MAYSEIESNKLNHFNIQHDNFIYSKVRCNGKFQYLRCTLFRNLKCKGFGKIDKMTDKFIKTQEHNHKAHVYNSNQIILRNKLKRAAETSSDILRDVFDKTCRHEAEATSITYRNARSIMYKRRKLQLPGMPKPAEEFCEFLIDSRYSDIHRGNVNLGGSIGVIFMSQKMMSIESCKEISFDGTFYTVPKIFYQLFTIFSIHHGHAIAMIHILMTNKSEELYSACVRKILEIFSKFLNLISR